MSRTAGHFDRVARHLLAAHPTPDLRAPVVILPNYHAAVPLAQALARAAQMPALLLPQMVTLNDWAQSVALETPVSSDSQRSALLYQHLRRQRWFGQADLWGMAQELLALFDDLTRALGALPADEHTFTAAVEQAWQARHNEALQLEARLVFELWHAMQSDAEPDPVRAYQRRLARLAENASRPLYVLRTSDWDAMEQRFLDEYARRAPVQIFDVREMEAPDDRAPLFFAASSLEHEARAAAMQVRRWLAEGRRDIAVVAQDRVAARRARALLERAGVLVEDETGWTFATLSVSAALDRWLTALQSDFYHHDLLDLLKSPFIFSDAAAGERKAAVYRMEQLLRRHGVAAGLEAFAALAGREDGALPGFMERLARAARLMDSSARRTLAGWLEALRASLAGLGMDAGLARDDAGAQLLLALESWRRELAGDDGRYRFAEWRHWLAQQLDAHTYRDSTIESSVRFTHLAATRWRAFDAVLLLGCDAGHLPGGGDGGRWFNDAVRGSLGLPTRASRAAREYDDLRGLLAMNGCVLVTWQRERDGEPGLLSPFLQLLRDKREAGGSACEERDLPALLAAEDAHRIELPQAAQPAPRVPAEAVPGSLSVSAYNALVACPYQFHARHVLRLNELDEVREAMEKRDYGELVHTILQRFHQRHPAVAGLPPGEAEAALRRISEEVFAEAVRQDFAARAWLARWLDCLPAYLEWQAESEAQGWHYASAESTFEMALPNVRLRGRIDRMDTADDGRRRVLDYKTQSPAVLRGKLAQPGEDVQLACYAAAAPAVEAAFVSIETGEARAVAPPHDLAELARLNAERLAQLMARIRGGAGLPANGIETVCAHCEMRGVCRKGEWSDG